MADAGARVGWLDCSSGCSGDMLLGALLDAGVPLEVLQQAVAAVAPEHVEVSLERVQRAGFAAVHARVDCAESTTHRTWSDVRTLLERADLRPAVRDRAGSAFARLARAEGEVHGVAAEQVRFHEVGALDAIADVVGVCAGLHHLALESLYASPVALGGGRVRAAHGELGVPAPAVVALLHGVPTYGGPVDVELCTPTGAALLAEWVTDWGSQPPMATSEVGVGAGSRDLSAHANVLRLLVGTAVVSAVPSAGLPATGLPAAGSPAADARADPDPYGTRAPLLVECNVDDLDPRLWPAVLTALLDAGAADAWLTPILMKKGRPAHTLSVLVTAERAGAVREVMFTHTSTIGVRESAVAKHALERQEAVVDVDGHSVRVKLGVLGGAVVNAQPEYDDVAAVAAATGRPGKTVLARAVAAARKLW